MDLDKACLIASKTTSTTTTKSLETNGICAIVWLHFFSPSLLLALLHFNLHAMRFGARYALDFNRKKIFVVF